MTKLFLFLFAFAVFTVQASPPASTKGQTAISLWPNGAPGAKIGGPEHDTTKPTDKLVAGRGVARIAGISDPTLTVYKPPASRKTSTAVLVFPGGGYRILAIDLEGTEVCHWLNSLGITAVLVKYRVPEPRGQPRYQAPLQDAQRALGLARQHAKEWGVDSARIGVIGFSAGGNLATLLSNNYEKRAYNQVDAADSVSCRPDFAMLIYPAYLTLDNKGEKLAPELHVSHDTPPSFIVQAEDDPVHVENSLVYFKALKDAHVPAEMHLYTKGGHGYGLRRTAEPITHWPDLAAEWLRTQGFLR